MFGRYLLSWGTTFFSFVTINDFICASNLIIWFFLEIYSDYAMVAMMIERCIVVLYPLQAKTIVTRRFTIVLLCICIIPLWLALIPISPFVLGVQTGSMWSESGLFCGWYQDRPGFLYFLWAYQLIIYTFHVILSGILVVILCTALAFRLQSRRQLTGVAKGGGGGESTREYSAMVIMLMIACINLVIFIPGLVALFISYLVDSSQWSQSALNLLSNFDRFSFSVPCVSHSINFLVYFTRIPTFRSELVNFFSFCFAK